MKREMLDVFEAREPAQFWVYISPVRAKPDVRIAPKDIGGSGKNRLRQRLVELQTERTPRGRRYRCNRLDVGVGPQLPETAVDMQGTPHGVSLNGHCDPAPPGIATRDGESL